MKINIILLTPHGRSGSIFLQSLLDGHESIIGFPIVYDWYDFTMDNIDTLDKENIFNGFVEKNAQIFSSQKNSFFNLGKANLESNVDHFNIDTNILKKHFYTIVKDINIFSEKILFESIHLSLALYMGYDISKVKYILVHIHEYTNVFTQKIRNKKHFNFIVENYPNFKFLATIRDPREDFNSWKKVVKKRDGQFSIIEIFTYIYHIKVTYNSLLIFLQKHVKENNYLIIDLNRFHIKQKKAVLKICNMLDINFSESLLKSTFCGISWEGNSSDNVKSSTFDIKKSIYKWDQELSYKEKTILNTFYKSYIDFFNYPIYNEYLNKIYSIYNFMSFFKLTLSKKDKLVISSLKSKHDIVNNKYKFLPFFLCKKIIHFLIFISRYKTKLGMAKNLVSNINNTFNVNKNNII